MRFSLRAMLVVVLLISVLCALLFAVPDRIALFMLLFISMHVSITAVLGIVYFDGRIRAFCVGAAAGAANTMLLSWIYSSSMVLEEIAVLLLGINSTDALDEYFFAKLVFVLAIGACLSGGLMGVMARNISIHYRHATNTQTSCDKTST